MKTYMPQPPHQPGQPGKGQPQPGRGEPHKRGQ